MSMTAKKSYAKPRVIRLSWGELMQRQLNRLQLQCSTLIAVCAEAQIACRVWQEELHVQRRNLKRLIGTVKEEGCSDERR